MDGLYYLKRMFFTSRSLSFRSARVRVSFSNPRRDLTLGVCANARTSARARRTLARVHTRISGLLLQFSQRTAARPNAHTHRHVHHRGSSTKHARTERRRRRRRRLKRARISERNFAQVNRNKLAGRQTTSTFCHENRHAGAGRRQKVRLSL